MNLNRLLTLSNPHTRFDIPGDREMFNRIVMDMLKHGDSLAPSSHWNWNLGNNGSDRTPSLSGYTDALFDEKYSRLEMMLDPWVGVTGMKPINATSVARYETFLRAVDQLKLLPDDLLAYGQVNDWRETDLGSVMDANLISAFFKGFSTSRRIAICEVGGGYGRLAEVLMGIPSGSAHYVLVDAVPGSLMYAYMYLKRQLPHLKIGSYYLNDPYSDSFDCYIMPAWQVKQLPDNAFDICINVESMQEMEQHHVDFYVGLFDRLARLDGLIYLSNARDYVFRGEWNIPDHWEMSFLSNTPRSWTADHPTQIFHKRTGKFALERSVMEGAFKQQVESWHEHQLVGRLEMDIKDRDRICYELQLSIEKLTVELRQHNDQQPPFTS